MIIEYAKKVMSGQDITPQEGNELISVTDEDTPLLLAMADKIRQHFANNEVDCCAIINGRSGKCSENCRFCAQSIHYDTGATTHKLLDSDTIINAARKAKALGAARFSIVTSGRSVSEGEEFNQILTTLQHIKNDIKIEFLFA
mgnify:FL=1